MPLSKPQQEIFNRSTRFAACSAGRRFGKSYLAVWEMARVARYPDKRVMYVAPSYRQAKSIIFETLKTEMLKRRWVKKINESELTIRLVNNSLITLRSADAADSIRGVSCDFAVLDECAFFDRSVWTDVIRPTLSDREGGALFISTPQGIGNWFYDLWTDAQHLEDWSAYQYTTLEGGNVSAAEIQSARRDLSVKTFRQEYEASFETGGNLLMYSFAAEHNVRPWTGELPPVLHVGLDLNISKMLATIAVKTQTGLHIVDEIQLENTNTDEMSQAITQRYPEHKFIVYPDPAGSARKTSAGGRTDHMILQQWGLSVKARPRHPAVKDRINTVNRLFQNAAGERNLFIDPSVAT